MCFDKNHFQLYMHVRTYCLIIIELCRVIILEKNFSIRILIILQERKAKIFLSIKTSESLNFYIFSVFSHHFFFCESQIFSFRVCIFKVKRIFFSANYHVRRFSTKNCHRTFLGSEFHGTFSLYEVS